MFKSLKIKAWRIRESIIKIYGIDSAAKLFSVHDNTAEDSDPSRSDLFCRIRTDYTVVSLPACLEFSGLTGQGLEHGLVVISLVLDTEGG